MTDDLTLLRRYVENRSDDAFAELVQRHLPLVYSAAMRRTNGDAHRAQDAAQLVFTALAREAASLTRHPSLVGWLYAATRNAARGLMRTEQVSSAPSPGGCGRGGIWRAQIWRPIQLPRPTRASSKSGSG